MRVQELKAKQLDAFCGITNAWGQTDARSCRGFHVPLAGCGAPKSSWINWTLELYSGMWQTVSQTTSQSNGSQQNSVLTSLLRVLKSDSGGWKSVFRVSVNVWTSCGFYKHAGFWKLQKKFQLLDKYKSSYMCLSARLVPQHPVNAAGFKRFHCRSFI